MPPKPAAVVKTVEDDAADQEKEFVEKELVISFLKTRLSRCGCSSARRPGGIHIAFLSKRRIIDNELLLAGKVCSRGHTEGQLEFCSNFGNPPWHHVLQHSKEQALLEYQTKPVPVLCFATAYSVLRPSASTSTQTLGACC